MTSPNSFIASHPNERRGEREAKDDCLSLFPKSLSERADFSWLCLAKIAHSRINGLNTVQMEKVERCPTYDFWVPVLDNCFVSELDIDPYLPYFGEKPKRVQKASEVFEQMIRDFRGGDRCDYHSDGEVTVDCSFQQCRNGDVPFHNLSPRQCRAAERHTVLHITDRYGKTPTSWASLAKAFRIPEVHRLKLIYKVAEARAHARRHNQLSTQASLKHSYLIKKALISPRAEISFNATPDYVTQPLKHFCFTCHLFGCQVHEGENVNPRMKIPDHASQIREKLHDKRKLSPCSQRCFMLEEWMQSLKYSGNTTLWTEEEVHLLGESRMIFRNDYCALAIAIGSKSCSEVFIQISSQRPLLFPQSIEFSNQNINSIAHDSSFLSQKNIDSSQAERLSDNEDDDPRKKRARRRKMYSRALKSAVCVADGENEYEDGLHPAFIPCNHSGPCYKRNGCACIINDLRCESTCGCNFGRYEEGIAGIGWKHPTDAELKEGVARKCSRRRLGCNCKVGLCNTNQCECFRENRVCNPDFCNDCDSNILPEQISIHDRRCRNVDLITARHKKTLIGQSPTHGFGLFAADYFESGELIGHYCGRTVEAGVVNKVLMASSKACNMTYAFDLTEKVTIDGGCYGSKVRFINHDKEARMNCEARFERVRGEGRIAIKAIKSVRPGEEFFFDYKGTLGKDHFDHSDDSGSEDLVDIMPLA